MTLLFFDGIENVLTMPRPQMIYSGNNATMQPGRDGSTNGCFRASGTAGTPLISYTPDAPIPTLIMGCAIRAASFAPNIRFFTGGTITVQSGIWFSGTGQWQFWTGTKGTMVASSSGSDVYTANSWVSLQVKLVLHTTAGSFQLRINGADVINYTGPTALTSGSLTQVSWNTTSTGTVDAISLDDLWVCDNVNAAATQGRPYNDFLGDLKVVPVVPTAAGDQTQWTPSVGANWDALDENPPDTVAYVSTSSANSGFRDLYQCTDLPVEAASVLAVQGRTYANTTDVGVASYKHLVKEHGVVSSLGSHNPNITVVPYTTALRATRPSDGALWSVADVNAMQIGVEVV